MNNDNILGWIMILFIVIILYKLYNDSDYFQLKCIVSTVDGDKYCVRERSNIKEASDLLAKTNLKMKKFVEYVDKKYPDQPNIRRLVKKFNPNKIVETLPTSEYTAYSENKGKKLAFCLNKEKNNNNNLIDENTLMFVALHELSHIATESIGHNKEFWDNFKFLLKEAKEAGLYNMVDYSKDNTEYCGMTITDNPYFE
jgi:RNase H-fold protein (predicted Holliday junction resolvase)